MQYEYNKTLKNHITMKLEPQGIEYSGSKLDNVFVPFEKMQEIQLINPMPGSYLLRVIDRDRNKYEIANQTVKGFQEFEKQNQEYCGFVRALHEHAAKYPHIRFISGHRLFYYTFQVMVWFFVATLVFAVVALGWAFLDGKDIPLLKLAPALVVLIFAIPLFRVLARKTAPATYTPEYGLSELLPAVKEPAAQ